MREKIIIKRSNHNNNSFFAPVVRACIEFSPTLLLTLFRWYVSFALFELAFGNEIPNPPFAFLQNDTLYNLTTSPQIQSTNNSFYAWHVFQNIVEYLFNDELGPISKVDSGNITHNGMRQIWSAKVCEANILLESNGTSAITKFFLLNLSDLLKSNSYYNQGLHCNKFSMASIIIMSVTGSVTLFACCALLIFVTFLSIRACQRHDYQEVVHSLPINK